MKFLSFLNTLVSAAGFCLAAYGFWINFKTQFAARQSFDWLVFEAPNSETMIIAGLAAFVIGFVCSVWFAKVGSRKGDAR